jgi:hypothetical protein
VLQQLLSERRVLKEGGHARFYRLPGVLARIEAGPAFL